MRRPSSLEPHSVLLSIIRCRGESEGKRWYSICRAHPFIPSYIVRASCVLTQVSLHLMCVKLFVEGKFKKKIAKLLKKKEFSILFSTTTRKHQSFGIQPSLCSNSHICTWLREKPHHCCSVTQSCSTLFEPLDCSTPGFPILHHLLELVQTHVHRVCDAIQPSHPLSSPSPPAFNPSQHQALFQGVSFLHQMTKGLGLQLQHQSFQWILACTNWR